MNSKHTAMKRFRKIILLCAVSLSTIFAARSAAQHQSNPKKFVFTNPTEHKVEVPFKLVNNLIVIPVSINNSDTLPFILDTGVSSTLLLELPPKDSLRLKYGRELIVGGFGGLGAITSVHCYFNDIRVGGIVGHFQDICLLRDYTNELSTRIGMKVYGLIGYDLLKDFVVEVNYDKKIMTFYPAKTYVYKKRAKQHCVPISIDEFKPYIISEITIGNGQKKQVRLLLDSGAGWPLWIDTYSNDSLKLPEKTITSVLGNSLAGDLTGYLGMVEQINFGQQEVNGIIACFPDSSLRSTHPQCIGRNGSIGSEMLRRFNLIIDYRNQKLCLFPNSASKEAFRYNMSGLDIAALHPEKQEYTIVRIKENSPAAKAGLKQGDVLISVNYSNTNHYTLDEVLYLFQSHEGRKLRVKVLRNGELIKTSFRLEKLL
jgi:hypothetical protein